MLNSFNLALGLFKSDIVLSLIFFLLLLLLLQLLLVVFLLHRIALTIVVMSLPHLQTNPTKLIFASTCHMNTTSVLINGSLTHRTLLSNDLVQPLSFCITYNFSPCFEITAIKRIMAILAANSTDFITTLTIEVKISTVVDKNGFVASFSCTGFNFLTFLRILETQKFIKMFLFTRIYRPYLLHKFHIRPVKTIRIRTHRKQLVDFTIRMAATYIPIPTFCTIRMPTNIVIYIRFATAYHTKILFRLRLIVLVISNHPSSRVLLVYD